MERWCGNMWLWEVWHSAGADPRVYLAVAAHWPRSPFTPAAAVAATMLFSWCHKFLLVTWTLYRKEKSGNTISTSLVLRARHQDDPYLGWGSSTFLGKMIMKKNVNWKQSFRPIEDLVVLLLPELSSFKPFREANNLLASLTTFLAKKMTI